MFDLFEEVEDLELEQELQFLVDAEDVVAEARTLDVYDKMMQGGIGIFFSDDD
jgi:hypothetical protein